MGASYFTNPIIFLIEVIFNLYLLAVLLRCLFQVCRVDFYNPLSQTLIKITSPLLNPLRKIIPGFGGIDLAAILLALIIAALKYLLIIALQGQTATAQLLLVAAVYEVVSLTLNIFLFAIIIQVILSWVAPGQHNPITLIIHQLTQPLLRPIRQVMPDLGGIDLSPMVALVLIQIFKMLLLPPLQSLV